MGAIDHAKRHFSARTTRIIEVPEWADESGKPLLVYATPITLAERQKLLNRARDNSLDMMVYALIYKAQNEQGDPLFTLEHKHALMHEVDPDVVTRVAGEILASASVADLEKN